MNVNATDKGTPARAVVLAALGLLVGAAGWLYSLYAAAFVVSLWSEELDPARAAAVVTQVAVIVVLVLAVVRARRIRAFLVGAVFAFSSVTLLYWGSVGTQ
jgi:hypothetical protein